MLFRLGDALEVEEEAVDEDGFDSVDASVSGVNKTGGQSRSLRN